MGFDRSWIKKVYRKIFYLECTILQVSCKILLNGNCSVGLRIYCADRKKTLV